MQNKLETINKIEEKLNELKTKSIVASDIKQFLKVVLTLVKEAKDNLNNVSSETKDTLQKALSYLEEEHNKLLSKNEERLSKTEKKALETLNKAEEALKAIKSIEVRDGIDGKDADEEKIIDEVLSKIEIPISEIETPKKIKEKLETLKGDKRLDISAIKGGEKLTTNDQLNNAISILDQRSSFLINKGVKHDSTLSGSGTDNDPLSVVGGGGGGTWGSITGTLSSQTDLQSALDAKVPYTGATGDVNLNGNSLTNTESIQFDLIPTDATVAEGKLVWNVDDGTLNLGMPGGNVNLQLGQEMLIPRRVKNTSGVDMTNGQLVYISGGDGVNAYVSLAKADAEATSANTIAMLTEDIANNQFGYATTFGLVRGSATQNIDTSGGVAGTVLYLSPTTAGAFTTTKPVAPNHMVSIGQIFRSHATEGSVLINIDNGSELEELHNVLISSPTDGQALRYETASGLWKNQTIDLSSYAKLTDTLQNITANSFITDGGTSSQFVKGDGTLDSSTYLTGNQSITLSGDVTGTGTTAITTTIASGAVDIAMLSATGTPSSSTYLRGDNTWAAIAGGGDMVLASAQTNSGIKTFLDTTMKLRNVANTFDGYFVNTNTADRIYTLPDATGTIMLTSAIGSTVQAYDADLTTWAGITPGTGVGTALAVNTGSAGAIVLFNGDAGTPSALVGTNISGTASSLTAGAVTNATLTTALTVNTGAVTLTGNVAGSTLTLGAGASSVSGSNTGDQTTISGNAGSATILETTRTIWGQNFNGSANVTGDITLGASNITMTGSIASTLSRVTKGWFTDLEVTNAIVGSITGSAPTLTTARAIYGNNFDGSAALTQVIASNYGGTGNGFTKFTGATTAEKTYTLPDANATILYSGGALGTPSSGTATNLTGTATGLTSGITNALKSATTTVDVSAATAPTSGQVLTATSGTAATWQTPAGGGADYIFIDASRGGVGIGGFGALAQDATGAGPYINLTNGATVRAGFIFQIPTGYTGISSITVYAVQNHASATLYFGGFNVWRFANDGTSSTGDSVTNQSITFGGATTGASRINTFTFPATAYDGLTFAAGETVSVQIRRSGADATDTYEADLLIAGIKVVFS